MQAGRLDRRITLQRKMTAISDAGGQSETWETVGVTRRAASLQAVRAEERFTAPERLAEDQVAFGIRYSAEIADLSPLWRIIYPALDGNSPDLDPASERIIYDILAVNEVGRREGFRVIAQRRPDALA